MARITVEDCLDRVENRFALVLLVSKRVKQLLKGASSTMSETDNKFVVNALREVAAGSVHYNIEASSQGSANEQIQADLSFS